MTGSGTKPSVANHRLDIDGLRALAILPVILYHYRFGFPGGYVGVDVFFTISGYLITGIIEKGISSGRFSIVEFYHRRVRRIFPALFAVLMVVTAATCIGFPPRELRGYAHSLVAAAVFSSNIEFYRESGYFTAASDWKPLLHTWSLALEEQFYLFWPLLLVLLSRRWLMKWKAPLLFGLLLASLALSAHWVNWKPEAAFYLLPARAWELALGALLSIGPVTEATRRMPRWAASIASMAGLLMVLSAALFYSSVTRFPGLAALLPCVGAALVLAAGEGGKSLGGRILSFRPLVWVGLISYSLYLWHWPLSVLGTLFLNHELATSERAALLVLSVVMATLSWRFVETPFRNLRFLPGPSSRWVLGGVAASIVFVLAGATMVAGKGFPGRGRPASKHMENLTTEGQAFQVSPCLVQKGGSLPNPGPCILGADSPGGQYQSYLWGDSQAAQLVPAIQQAGRNLNLSIREVTKAGCPPLVGVRYSPMTEMLVDCLAFNENALKAIKAERSARVVILAGRWEAYARGTILLSRDGRVPAVSESRNVFVSSLRETISSLLSGGHRVLLVGGVPIPPFNVVGCLSRASFNGWSRAGCAETRDPALFETERLIEASLGQSTAGLGPNVRIIHPFRRLCTDGVCALTEGDAPLYMDPSHLSTTGAARLSGDIQENLAALIQAAN